MDLRSVPLILLVALGGGCGEPLEDLDLPGDDDPGEIRPAAVPADYYDSTKGKSGADLLRALSTRVAGHKALSYSAARNAMFGTIADPDNDNVVLCIYTGLRGTSVTNSDTAGKLGLNTEHSWPQSLGAKGVAQADLHHLFPTESAANGRRGNYPFGEVKGVTWTAPNLDGGDGSRLGTDAGGRTVFEPQGRVKGDIARALLYFYTRYASQPPSGFSVSNFTVEEATLRRWHEQDPPDADERAHNDLVFGVQGNRNPYIDHPEFVRAISSFR